MFLRDYRFPSYEARYYDPVLGRFISADTIVPSTTDPQALNRYAYANNNPILYTDLSGHFGLKSIKKGFKKVSKTLQEKLGKTGFTALSFGIQVGIVPVPFLSPLQSGILGTAMLTQSKSGRYVLAGEVIIGTTAASWYCGGCGGWATGAAIGAATTGAIGGYSAAVNGGDISKGVLFGTSVGALTGGFASYYAPTGAAFNSLSYLSKLSIASQVGAIGGFGSGAATSFAGGRGSFADVLLGAGIGAGTSAALAGGLQAIAPAFDTLITEYVENSDFMKALQNINNSTKIHPSAPGSLDGLLRVINETAVALGQFLETNRVHVVGAAGSFGAGTVVGQQALPLIKSFCQEGGRCKASGKF
ncbi:MAG: hypothetical protein NPIRA04_00480 [Nitrospirales bacterium]|nr:MAG: hypothetical protein NPIRA04_00480 [Nitrospirales bacterium]